METGAPLGVGRRRGVCYDVGRVLYGDWRKDYSPALVHRELEIIARDLHCNAVRICARDLDRLVVAAKYALDMGLEVWLSPELWNKSPKDTLNHLVAAAEAAEELRKAWPEQVVLSVGTELTLFMKGIVPGRTLWQRMRNAFAGGIVKSGRHNPPLNAYLAEATAAAGRVYEGPLTYGSLSFEQVDWEPFDVIGIDHYRGAPNRDRYAETLTPLLAQGKPVAVLEFGCCTYRGAEAAGGRAFDIVDLKSLVLSQLPVVGRFVRPRLQGPYVRDEALQAREIIDQLDILERAGVNGTFVFTFVFPNNPYDDEPIHDLDMASYSLVKSYAHGRRGATYPDMTWEPKEAFWAVAEHYAK